MTFRRGVTWITCFATLAFMFIPRAHAASEFYELEIAARDGMPGANGSPVLAISGNASINSLGELALMATTVEGPGIYVSTAPNSITLISGAPSTSTIRNGTPTINEAGYVIDGRRTSNTTFVELFNSRAPTARTVISSGRSDDLGNPQFPTPWASDFAYMALSKGINQTELSSFRAVLGVLDRTPPVGSGDSAIATPRQIGTYQRESDFNVRYLPIPFRPRIADDGTVVVKSGVAVASPIIRVDYNVAGPVTFLTDDAFTEVGNSPGISPSGLVTAFSGNRTFGRAIYAVVELGGGLRETVVVAGEATGQPELGYSGAWPTPQNSPVYFNDIDLSARVGVIHKQLGRPGLLDDVMIFAFLGTPNAASGDRYFAGRKVRNALGLWTVRIDVVPSAAIPGGVAFVRRVATPVVQVGDPIGTGSTGITSVGTISIHDPIADYTGSPYPDGVTEAQLVTEFGQAKADAIGRELRRGAHRLAFVVSGSTGTQRAAIRGLHLGCSADVERLPQGHDAPWRTNLLDSQTSETLGGFGCVVTTVAMQLNHFGELLASRERADGDIPDRLASKVGLSVDPGQLNRFWIKQDTTFPIPATETRFAFESSGQLRRPDAVALANAYISRSLGPSQSSYWWVNEPVSFDVARNRIQLLGRLCKLPFEDGASSASDPWTLPEPSSARVTLNPMKPFGHDVLVAGVGRTDFVIADPSNSDKRLLLQGFPTTFKLNGHVQDPDDVSYLSFSTSGNVGLTIIDGAGLRVGRDLITGALTEGIPGASYDEFETGSAEDANESLPMLREVTLPRPGLGNFTVELSAVEQGPFSFTVSSTGASGAVGALNTRLAGVGVPGARTLVSVDFDATPGITIVSLPVPQTVGATEAEARSLIATAGLVVGGLTRQASSAVPAGSVISQSPSGGTIVSPGSAVALVISSGGSNVTVPNVVGLTQSDATNAITAEGLVVGIVVEQSSSSVPAGSVISQNPAGGASVAAGSAVNLVVSTGPAPVTVPNVIGLTQSAATNAITNAGLVVGTITQQTSSSVPAESVISQNPSGGTSVLSGAAVNLVVSSGPAPVTVPNVGGLTQSAATAAITNAGLVVGTITQESSSSVPAGSVISQNPSGGTSVLPGDAVNLVVSSGPAPVSVPNVVGLTQSGAASAITNAGLVVGTVTQESSSSIPAGSVISQNPVGGVSVLSGTAVNLVVSSGPALVTVPNVVGLTQSNATSAITSAGLAVGTVTQQSSSSVPAGSVISQSPASGASVAAGSAVNLVVSSGPAPVAVPNVVGLTQSAATSSITSAGLALGTVTQQSSSSVPAGNVISQNPAGGASVVLGSLVNLVVSSGPAPVSVPNVVGLTQSAATNAITSASLVVGTVTQESSSSVPAGNVVSQNPLGGVSVLPGAAVNLVVSTGPALVAVPDVVGLTQTNATNAITSAGLAVGAVTQQASSSVPAGSVISQNPAGGASVVLGSLVNLVVSSGPAPVSVPNVVGLTQSAATSAITSAGLVVGTVTQESSSSIPAGDVVSQDPLGGISVLPGAAVSLVVSSGPAPVSVPSVVGLTQSAATSAITSAGLVLGTVTQQSSSSVPSGSVISQSPASGTSVAAGSAVNLVVSTGPAPVSVPNVAGLTQSAATSAITSAGLVVGTVTQQSSSSVAAGSVISQNPAAGASVSPGSAVNLVVSTGPAPVIVPSVVGLTQSAATSAITSAGLALGTVTQQSSSSVPAGSVVSQNPAGGASVAAGSAVNLVVSSGPAQVSVPGVVGLTQTAATNALTAAGLAVGTVTQQASSSVPAGTVVSQSPTAGTSVAPGSVVNLVVSTGPASVSVPDVVGLSQGAAASAIANAGLNVGAVTQQTSATVPAGNVISQNPSGGTSVVSGSAVALVVSSGPAPTAIDFDSLRKATLAAGISFPKVEQDLVSHIDRSEAAFAAGDTQNSLRAMDAYLTLAAKATGRVIGKKKAKELVAIAERLFAEIRRIDRERAQALKAAKKKQARAERDR